MTTFGATLLIFVGMIGIWLLIMQPVLASYTQNYMLRVRSGGTHIGPSQTQSGQRSHSLTSFCETIGRLALQIYPGLASAGIRKMLVEASLRRTDHIAILTGAKILCSGLLGLFAAAQGFFLFAPIVAFFGWTLPNYTVIGRAKQRRQKLFFELPTVIDLVAVCSRAGLGLLSSIDRITKNLNETCPVMKEELDQLLTDIKVFARPLRVALQDMAERCGVEELENLVSALIVSDQKGADIGTALQKQSIALRDRIKRKAEEQLSTAPVKMIPVIFVFIVPLIMVPSLGPSVMHLMDALSKFNSR